MLICLQPGSWADWCKTGWGDPAGLCLQGMILPPASILWDPGSLPRAPSEFKLSRWVNFSCTLRAATSICYSAAQVVWKTSGWPLSFRPWLPHSCLGYHSFLPASFSMIKCSCARVWRLSVHVHVHFAEDLWPIKTVITHTFSLAKFVRMLNQSNHSFHMYSTVLFMHLFLLTVLQKPPVVWTEVSVVVSRTLHGSGRCWFCWLRSKTAPWLIKNLALFSFALACVYKRSTTSGLTCPRSSLSSINLSALRYRADQKQNNGRERGERWKTETV